MENQNLNDFRREYQKGILDKENANADPFKQFGAWLQDALKYVNIDPTAMVLSTVSDNKPSSRIVLLKEFDENGFCFFTNYESRKALEIEKSAYASILFFWKELDRQIRIEGIVEKTNSIVSDEYFNSRPYDSRISAIISPQSDEIKERGLLDKAFEKMKMELEGNDPDRPVYWGGYVLKANYFEFWQGRENRLHDRVVYEKKDEGWKIKRIAP